MNVAALYVRADSVYKTLPGVDAWDASRDARAWRGGSPVVAHPPCGQWARLRSLAKPNTAEKACGPAAVAQVRQWGGVLEHPTGSKLWEACDIPRPGEGPDAWGGYTVQVDQLWWGHKARKSTWLYVVGVARCDMPVIPLNVACVPTHQIGHSGRRKDGTRAAQCLPDVNKAEREATPPAFAAWLVEVARRARRSAAPPRAGAPAQTLLARLRSYFA